MKQQVIDNLKSVRDEAMDILANIESVRGAKYKALVNGLILTTKLVETVAMMERAEDGRQVATLRECFLHVLHDQVREFVGMAEVSEEDLGSAMEDADRISHSVHGLIERAFSTGMSGVKFGDQ